MRAFAALYAALDRTTKTSVKTAALAAYFRGAAPADAAWAVYFLSGRKPRQVIPTRRLAAWAAGSAGIPDWLFDECHGAVGDLAEVIALLLPPPARESEVPLACWVEERLLPLRAEAEERQREALLAAWDELGVDARLVLNKLITGEFRVGVSGGLLLRALSEGSALPVETLAHRLAGNWEPSAAAWEALVAPDTADADISRPYPFFLAHPLTAPPAGLGPRDGWLAEWKWDGIRAQLVRRQGRTFVWSRGGELVTERFPELAAPATRLPDGTVIDGEVLAWEDGAPLPFTRLSTRVSRKTLTRAVLAAAPAAMVAYDLLEDAGIDVRARPLEERRARLADLVAAAGPPLMLSAEVPGASWDDLAAQREASRARRVEGLMLKRRGSPYGVGRPRGDWWKWKVDPYAVDAVLIYAQRGSGRRASLYTDYTFGVWDRGELVPFAKAYSGLTDDEIRRVDAFVRRNTVERHGPVRVVRPELVFELGFERVEPSARHRSGVAVRFPRMLRWRHDKRPEDADGLDAVRDLVER